MPVRHILFASDERHRLVSLGADLRNPDLAIFQENRDSYGLLSKHSHLVAKPEELPRKVGVKTMSMPCHCGRRVFASSSFPS